MPSDHRVSQDSWPVAGAAAAHRVSQMAPRAVHRQMALDEPLRRCIDAGETPGIVALVAHGDDVQAAALGVRDLATGAPMRRDTLFRIASMTKPVLAAAAMILVEEGLIGLHDPVEPWLPELANRAVLRSIESPLNDTVPARRSITLDDLLTLRFGLGAIMAPPGRYPVQIAMTALGLSPGPQQLGFGPDAFMARIGQLPLIHQPGERWMYHTGADVLAVLIARVACMRLEDFLRERIFAPLGMHDTGFSVRDSERERLATCYAWEEGVLRPWDGARGGRDTRPPAFPNALVTTADDYLTFARMLLHRGRIKGGRLLGPDSVRLMTTDHITPEQKAASPFFPDFWAHRGWGYGGGVSTGRGGIARNYGWMGGFGTGFLIDPGAQLAVIVMQQRLMRGPDDTAVFDEVQNLAYGANQP
jgi:CubicO group peptidase (beta-lactamase class C family)